MSQHCKPHVLVLSLIAVTLATAAAAQTTPATPAARTAQPAAGSRTLHLGSTPWSPFTDAPGKARFAIDLVDAALKRIGVSAETTIMDEGKLTPALQNRTYDGSPALWADDEREKTMLFSDAYLENRLLLVARKGTDVSAKTLDELAGKRFALVEGYSYGGAVKRPGPLVIVNARTAEDTLQQVLASRADYALIDELMVDNLIEKYPQEVSTRLAIGVTPVLVRPLHFALRRDVPGAQAIIDRFNGELRKMVADRSYHRLLHIPWIEADVDGDGKKEYVPASDQAGVAPPDRRYELFTETPDSMREPAPRRYYVGGSIYEQWLSVPDAYKVKPAGAPAPMGGQTASLFTIRW